MRIVRLQNNDKNAALNFLWQRPHSSMFLLNNMEKAGLEYSGKLYSGEYWASLDEAGAIRGILAHFWNGSLMVQAPEPDLLSRLADHFRQNTERPVTGFLGESDQVKQLIHNLDLPAEAFYLNRSEDLYQLLIKDMVAPCSSACSKLQTVCAAELDPDILFDWLKAYELEAIDCEPSEEHDKHIENRVKEMRANKYAWALLDEETPVSLSAFNATLPEIVQIGPVWTPPEHRSKGYARTLVALTLQAAKDRGVKQSVLFTENQAAAKAYEAIGFKRNGSFHLAFLNEPQDIKAAAISA